jgi:uncharacterized repeat protein (TIGR02543 family)
LERVLYPFLREEGIVKINLPAPKRALHLSIVVALMGSLLSFVATPARATDTCTPDVIESGGYVTLKFLTTGTCTFSTPAGTTMMQGLIVGGGGGGGTDMGGGGGGGGYVEFETLTVTSQTLSVTVGGGGAGAVHGSGAAGLSGGNSVISGTGIILTSLGGAGGASLFLSDAAPARSGGGSGGGSAGGNGRNGADLSSAESQTAQSQTPSLVTIGGNQFGNNGSRQSPDGDWLPGGGGGAGGAGSADPGNGGIGRANSILGTSYFWAGGGGGSGIGSVAGNGGNGGGGAGGEYNANSVSTAGTGLNPGSPSPDGKFGGNGGANTGGGGGGSTWSNQGAFNGGNGGSGIVVLKYLATTPGAAAKVKISRASEGAARGVVFTTQPQIGFRDADFNTVTTSSPVVTATISAGGTLIGTTTAAASSGLATFSDLGITGTIGVTYTITYSAPGMVPATQRVTVTARTCDGVSFICQPGDISPSGGVIFYAPAEPFLCGPDFTSLCTYLEAAPKNWKGGGVNDPAHYFKRNDIIKDGVNQNNLPVPGIANESSPNMNANQIGLGYKNSIVLSTFDTSTGNAAVASRSYSGGGKNDWYLPTLAELRLLAQFAHNQTPDIETVTSYSNPLNTGVPASHAFLETSYLSSSQSDTNWHQNFVPQGFGAYSPGEHNTWGYAATDFATRPIRAFAATVTASKVAVTQVPVGTRDGTAFATQPKVVIQSAVGVRDFSSSETVTATVSAGGTLIGTTAVRASLGLATFSNLGIDGTIGDTYTITFTVAGLTVATTAVYLTGAEPGAPTGVSATLLNSTTAVISYTAPANNGGVPITAYIATADTGGLTATVSRSGSGTISVSGLTLGQTYQFTVVARNAVGDSSASSPSTSITPIGAALVPTFGSPTVTADGFSVQISNYDNAFTWNGTATASGSVTIDGSGLVTVTGVAPGTSSTATITTTRTNYADGSATVNGSSASDVATLSALTLSSGTLSPTFTSSTDSYSASVLSSTSSMTVTPTRTQANATVTVNGTTVASGVASGSIALTEGTNTITVVGTAQDGTTTSTYTITVTRPAPPTIAISTTDFQPRASTNVGVNLSNFDTSLNYQATVKFVNVATNADVTNGTLSATSNGTSLIPGFTSFSGTKLGFKGTYAQIAAALTSLRWNPETGTGNITLRIGIASMPGTSEFYFDANSGRYYKFVSTPLTWANARTAAEATTLFGLRGYLAEVNTAAENFFIGRETSATNVWIGASDRTTEGTWTWDGATSTYAKPTGSGSNSGRTAAFHSWANGEPNDWPWHGPSRPEREDCAVTNWQGRLGMWNDWPCLVPQPYLIEFGGRPGETSTSLGATLTTTVNAMPPAQYAITYDPDGGSSTPATLSRTSGQRFALAGAITRADSGGASFRFSGWGNGGKTYRAGETITVGISDLLFEAEWIRQYEVTYLNSGGTFAAGNNNKDSECPLVSFTPVCAEGQEITLNLAPTRVGFTFIDWKNQSGTSVVDSNNALAGIQTAVTSTNYIFAASWTPITYTITYTSTGSSVPNQSALEEDQTFIVGSPGTRAGFEFSGWSDGDSIHFPGSEIIIGTSNMSLTAQWTAVFTVTYSQGLGTGTPSTDSASYPSGYALAVATDAGISRSGFTFGGWSDGTTTYQVGDIYTIGSSSITLTAQWSAVQVTQAPAPTPTPTPTVTPKPVETIAEQAAAAAAVKVARENLQINVAKSQSSFQEIIASLSTSSPSGSTLIADPKSGVVVNTKSENINSSQSANIRVAARNISLSNDVIEAFKSRVRITATTTGISVTPVSGFTGVLVVPFAATVDGVETVVLNKIVVNPAPPVAQRFAPTSINQSSIAWAPSTSQTTGYLVKINGKEICQTTATTCPVAQLIGPKSVVTIAALGNDKTISTPVVIPYVATRPIPALKVNFALGSSILSTAQKNEIRNVARVIDTQGFTRLVVSGFTDSSGSAGLNRKLSEARAMSVAAFMRTLLPKIAIKASAFGPNRPVASNVSKSGQAQNRRTEIATW